MEYHTWMYKIYVTRIRGLVKEFINGVGCFVEWTLSNLEWLGTDQIRCSCSKYKNKKFQVVDMVRIYLYSKRFVKENYNWTYYFELFIPTNHLNC
jgi:hypothetical protein